MPVSVLEHVSGEEIPVKWRKDKGINPGKTFKVIFIPDDEIENPPKRKVYSNNVKAIVAEGKRLSKKEKKAGITRKKSFERLDSTLKKIGHHIKQNENKT